MPTASATAIRPGRPRDEAIHRAILAAATDLLCTAGHGSFSIERVARRARVAKTSIYRRWPSKGALLLDLYMDGIPETLPRASGRPIREDLAEYLNQTVERVRNPAWSNTVRSLVRQAQDDPEMAELVRERLIEPRRRAGRALLKRGMTTGEIRKDVDIEIALDFLFGAVWYRLLLGHAPIDEAFAGKLLDQFFLLFAARVRKARNR